MMTPYARPAAPARRHRRSLAVAALLMGAALGATACGTVRADGQGAGSGAGRADAGGAGVGGVATGTPSPRTTTAAPASPYAEPGAGDGAPHYQENNGFRRPRAMSAASEEQARAEARRVEPVLKKLWQRKEWDAAGVRTALLGLGYQERRTGPGGKVLGGKLVVEPMAPRFETDHYVTPPGARVGLYVRPDACVTAFVQPTNYQVSVNGPYLETGCFEPPTGH
ncbi:hypothetical protein ABT160_20480 [Streptomyces sp. NPDC001941]|uniref:hypothetical protein n=1 Tax=Streptomyces sp. NPDC001941 TaxID=3154659 RepID=UPI003319C219